MASLIGEILGAFVLVFLIAKLFHKIFEKFTSVEPKKALIVSTIASALLCAFAALYNVGVSALIIYPLAGIGAWFYGYGRLKSRGGAQ